LNYRTSRTRQRGQAIIEFIVVIPVLLLLVAASWTLLAYQAFPVWMDEFLGLEMSIPNGTQVYRELTDAHENSMIPPYPSREDFHWKTDISNPIKFPPPLSTLYPGRFFRAQLVLDPARMIRESVPFSGLLPSDPTPSHRGLTYLSSPTYEDGDVKGMLEKIVLGGIRTGALIRALRHIGIDPVHLNLDALPTPPESTGDNHVN